MDILRITAQWAGFQGAPGYSNFHFTVDGGFFDGGLLGDEAEAAATTAANRVMDGFGELVTRLPGDVSISIASEAPILDSDTGEIQGSIPLEVSRSVAGTQSGGYSAASGAVVNWRTNDFRFGRRIRGRTFLVPISGASYENDGTFTSASLGHFRSFAAAILGSEGGPEFGIWSRPRAGSGGVFATATAASVPDMAAVLRSRRD